jgi:TatD DNase family protein
MPRRSFALWDWPNSARSTLISTGLPPLDCHAHLSPDVTTEQLGDLGDATIFAVTRSLAESEEAVLRSDAHLLWGCGVHPGVASARSSFDQDRFRILIDRFALVGEVGLDRRAGQLLDQVRVFRGVLDTIVDAPVLVSVHSAGQTDEVAELVCGSAHRGIILHWFLGDDEAVRLASGAGCYFSVNAVMPDDALRRIPPDRMLPETDFPATAGRGGGRRPGDTARLEERISKLLGQPVERLRWSWYRNLRTLALASGAIERLPRSLSDRLLSV